MAGYRQWLSDIGVSNLVAESHACEHRDPVVTPIFCPRAPRVPYCSTAFIVICSPQNIQDNFARGVGSITLLFL